MGFLVPKPPKPRLKPGTILPPGISFEPLKPPPPVWTADNCPSCGAPYAAYAKCLYCGRLQNGQQLDIGREYHEHLS